MITLASEKRRLKVKSKLIVPRFSEAGPDYIQIYHNLFKIKELISLLNK